MNEQNMTQESGKIGGLSATTGLALWCDLATDRDRADFLRDGRAHATGIVAAAIQSELADAFNALAAIREICTTDHESKDVFIRRVLFSLPNVDVDASPPLTPQDDAQR
jgi:hypothetical protein